MKKKTTCVGVRFFFIKKLVNYFISFYI